MTKTCARNRLGSHFLDEKTRKEKQIAKMWKVKSGEGNAPQFQCNSLSICHTEVQMLVNIGWGQSRLTAVTTKNPELILVLLIN